MTEEETILGVPVTKIKTWRNLRGTWRYFGRKYEQLCETKQQFDALDVKDLEIAKYILDRQSVKQRDDAIKAADEAMSSQQKKDWVADREERERLGAEEHDKKYERYLEDFDTPTQADRDAVRTLAGIALAIEKNQAAQYAYYDRIDPASIQNKKILSDEVARLSTEFRGLQKMLGIDMPTRLGKDQAQSAMDYVRQIVEGARAFVDEHITQMIHCDILIREDIDHFPETYTKLQKECPRCGDIVTVEYGERNASDNPSEI